MDLFRGYTVLCAVLGALEVVDGLVLWQRKGRVNPALLAFSALETLWFCVSVFVLRAAWHEQPVVAALAGSFCLYCALTVVDGIRLVAKDPEADPVANLPPRIVARGIAFGAAFFVASLLVIAHLGMSTPT